MAFDEKFVDHIIKEYKGAENFVALDIGANVGMYTVKLAQKFQKVYAFEINKETCATLRNNLERYKVLDKVEIINKGIADKTMPVHMFLQGNGTNRGGNTLSLKVAEKRKWGHSPDKSEIVDAITLDDWMAESKIENLRFIKMDIEGGEDFAWFGASTTLTSNYLDIVLEVHNCVDYDRLYKYFQRCGYKMFDTNSKPATHFRADTHYLVTNRA